MKESDFFEYLNIALTISFRKQKINKKRKYLLSIVFKNLLSNYNPAISWRGNYGKAGGGILLKFSMIV